MLCQKNDSEKLEISITLAIAFSNMSLQEVYFTRRPGVKIQNNYTTFKIPELF